MFETAYEESATNSIGDMADELGRCYDRIATLEQLVRDWCDLYEAPDYGDCIRLRKRMDELGIGVDE